jgi:hypothetical protein
MWYHVFFAGVGWSSSQCASCCVDVKVCAGLLWGETQGNLQVQALELYLTFCNIRPPMYCAGNHCNLSNLCVCHLCFHMDTLCSKDNIVFIKSYVCQFKGGQSTSTVTVVTQEWPVASCNCLTMQWQTFARWNILYFW